MKKFILIRGIIFALFLSVIIFFPLIFKKPIQTALDDAMEENLNATVLYDLDKFSLSFF